MKRLTFSMLTVGLLIFLLFPVPTSHATTIYYDATDLTDIPAGDLWQYTYTVSDYTFNTDYGFTIDFDASLYSHLDPATHGNADWDTFVIEPNPSGPFPYPGTYEAWALVDSASLADPFTVAFCLAGGTWGSWFATF